MNEDPVGRTLSSSLPFEQGDRLCRDEFERLCESMSMMYRAELIDGIVSISPPSGAKRSGRLHARIMTWLGLYEAETIGFDVRDQIPVRLNLDTVVQPDIVLIFKPEPDQQTAIAPAAIAPAVIVKSEAADSRYVTDSRYVNGGPELIVENIDGWDSIDLTARKAIYGKNGVQEYLVWRSLEEEVDWFYWEHGIYMALLMDTDGLIRSRACPGLWLDRDALLAGDMQAVLAGLHLGLQWSSDHPEASSLEKNLGTD